MQPSPVKRGAGGSSRKNPDHFSCGAGPWRLFAFELRKSARKISCEYHTEDGTAIHGIDYDETSGTLELDDQEAIVWGHNFDVFLSYQSGYGSKHWYQNGTLVIGNMDQNLRSPSSLILTRSQVIKWNRLFPFNPPKGWGWL